MTEGKKSTRIRVPTLRKMGVVLNAFTPDRPTWKLLELSRELGWDGATTHRFLKALVEIGMLECADGVTYQIGVLPLKLAAVSSSTQPEQQAVLRRMIQITAETGLTTQIGVLDGESVAIIASEESRDVLKAAARLGERLPLHATAVGKAILSQLSDAEVLERLPETLEAYTERTITDRAVLLDQIRAVRERGMARVESELSVGLDALAVPISRSWFGSNVAALTCAGLSRNLAPAQWKLAEATLLEHCFSFAATGDGRLSAMSKQGS